MSTGAMRETRPGARETTTSSGGNVGETVQKKDVRARLVGRSYDEQVQMLAPDGPTSEAAPAPADGEAPEAAAAPDAAAPEGAAPGGAAPEAEAGPANMAHLKIVPIVEPHPYRPADKVWLGINAASGGVSYVIGEQHAGKAAADLPLGTQDAMFEMFMIETADGATTGFVGAERAQEALALAREEAGKGAKAADYPDMVPCPANLKRQVLQPIVKASPHGEGKTWLVYDVATGALATNLGPEWQGQDANALPIDTKKPTYVMWSVDGKDGAFTGAVGEEQAGAMYDVARKDGEAAAPAPAPDEAPGEAKKEGDKPTPKNLSHRRIIPIVEPHPFRAGDKTWLALNADTGGVAYVLGDEHRGRAAADLPFGTQEPMFDMYMVELADGTSTGFVGAEHAAEALALAQKEEGAGAPAADYPDMTPCPANLQRQVLQPTVGVRDGQEGQTWLAIDVATGEPATNLGTEWKGKDANALPVGTKDEPYVYWGVERKDGAYVGSVGADAAGTMYEEARRAEAGEPSA